MDNTVLVARHLFHDYLLPFEVTSLLILTAVVVAVVLAQRRSCQFYWLVVIALIASAIGIYYYLRVVVLMFFRESHSSQTDVRVPAGAGLVILVMVLGTFLGPVTRTFDANSE